MAQFIIVYLGGEQPSSPEEGRSNMESYMQWLAQLGDAVVSPANPLKNTHVIGVDGKLSKGSSVAMSGYTIIEASSIDVALAMAKGCPFLEIGGTLEVSELMKIPVGGR